MIRKLHLLPLLATLMILVASPAFAQKTFRWKVKAGEKLSAVLEQKSKQTMTIGDRTIEVPTAMTLKMLWEVKDVNEADFVLIQTIEQAKLKMTAPGIGDVEYDSASKEEPQGVAAKLSETFKPMLGVPFEQKMNSRGKVLDVKVPEKAFEGIKKNPMLKSLFSEKTMSEMIGKVSPELPEEAIKAGYSWQQKTENKTPVGSLKMDSKFTYKGEQKVEGKTADVFDVDATMEFGEAPKGPFAPKITLKDQDFEGKIYFDQAAGRIIKTTVKQEFEMDVRVADQAMKQVMENTITMTVAPAQ